MRVTFPRLPNGKHAYALVERDDGVVYRRYGGTAGPRLPQDIVHLVVERELGISDGIWGGIAAGAVFEGTRPRLRTGLLADLVSSAAALDELTPANIRQLAQAREMARDTDMDPAAIAAAARALQVETARWARLRVGEELRYEWPRHETG